MNNSLLKFVAGLTLLLAICNLVVTYLPKADAENRIYVSPTGNNYVLQASKDTPLRTVQKAVDSAKPGDRIILMPGDYCERIHLWKSGTVEKPITLEAEQPGTVTIHWKDETRLSKNPNWKSEGGNVYSLSTQHPVYRASHNDEALFQMKFGNLKSLRKLIEKPNPYSTVLYSNKTCYLYLKNGLNPTQEIITTHQPVPQPREWGEFRSSNLWVEGDNWIIKGLNLEYGIGSSIRIWNGENIRIEDCSFSGATYGVLTSKSLKPAKNLKIRNCLYHNFPQYDWKMSWLKWNELYAHYDSSSLSHTSDAPMEISNCVAVHCADGIQLTTQKDSEKEIRVFRNLIANCTDDAMEFDGPSCHVNVEENLFLDSFVSLGLSPVSQGPTEISRNFFLHPTPNQEGALLKLLSPKNSNSIIQNVSVSENLFWGNWLSWWNEATPVKNLELKNNRFFVQNQKTERWPPSVFESDNHYNTITNNESSLNSNVAQIIKSLKELENSTQNVKNLRSTIQRKTGPAWWNWKDNPVTLRTQKLLNLIEQQL